MRLSIIFITFFILNLGLKAQVDFTSKFEKTNGSETVTYYEGIEYYRILDEHFASVKLIEIGTTDAGFPLHLVLFNTDEEFDLSVIKNSGKGVLFINNAIHAGETDGVDASMMLIRNLAQGKILKDSSKNIVVAVIPFFNVGGVLNRSKYNRVNQNGPSEVGFRGNARSLNLNRDFSKANTKNMWGFWDIFHKLDPDFFIDTHVSNGADYQYTITLISNQKDKLSPLIKPLLEGAIKPYMYDYMEQKQYPLTPYINVYGVTQPDEGLTEFPDWPRYSSGYVNLFQTIGFITESHMLKPNKERVMATYHFITGLADYLSKSTQTIIEARAKSKLLVAEQKEFAIKWELDGTKSTKINFKGYEGSFTKSSVTKQPRLFYNRNKPYEKWVDYYNFFKPSVVVSAPKFYLVSKAWDDVVLRLKANGVVTKTINHDTTISVSAYRIEDYETMKNPYEGHYPHTSVVLCKTVESVKFFKGDYMIEVNQPTNRFIVEMLEPKGEDSFFKWNFFDPILDRKEHFSGYVFEEIAESILNENPKLNKQFRALQKDSVFASNRYTQLDWIYKKSPYFEKTYLLYPVFRIEH